LLLPGPADLITVQQKQGSRSSVIGGCCSIGRVNEDRTRAARNNEWPRVQHDVTAMNLAGSEQCCNDAIIVQQIVECKQ
jgi:hypothetical protein